jgi:hypothetical protein
MTEQLGNNEGCSKCKRQQPVACTARGAAGAKSGLGSRETEGSNSQVSQQRAGRRRLADECPTCVIA